jgi:CubicO group peptidase (beta-lactamase class C family)
VGHLLYGFVAEKYHRLPLLDLFVSCSSYSEVPVSATDPEVTVSQPRRRKVPILFLLCTLSVAQDRNSSDAVPQSPDFTAVRTFIQQKMVEQGIPSIAVAVAQDGKILWQDGFGLADREKHIPATAHTAYYVASITKSITSTAVMVLSEHKQLKLDAPVNNYLGAAKVHSPMWDANSATVRQVATHTAGLTTYARKCGVGSDSCQVSTDKAIERYGILFWAPGDHFDYSNLGYGILDEVIAHVSGKTYGTFLQDEVFRPLGMTNCSLEMEAALEKVTAAQYDSTSHKQSPLQVSDTPGASSVHCSVHDLALFGMFMLKAHLPSQRPILSDQSIDMILNSTVDAGDGERYGIGWWVQPDLYGYHSVFAQGGTNDSFALLQIIPSENIVVAVLANTGTTVPSNIVEEVLSDLLPQFAEARKKAPSVPKHDPTKAHQIDRPHGLVGKWVGSVSTWKGDVPLTLLIPESDHMRATVGSQASVSLSDVHVEPTHLYGVARGDLGAPDAAQPPYDIQIEVYLNGDRLVGAATAVPRPDEDGPELPYWVVLKRVR